MLAVGGVLVAGDVFAGTAEGGTWVEPFPDRPLHGKPVNQLTKSASQPRVIEEFGGPYFGDKIGVQGASPQIFEDSLGNSYWRGFGTFEDEDLNQWAFAKEDWDYFYGEYADEYEIYGEAQRWGLKSKPTYTEAEIQEAIEKARRKALNESQWGGFVNSDEPCAQAVSGDTSKKRYYVGLPDGKTGVAKRNDDNSWSFYFPLKEGARSRLVLEYNDGGKMQGLLRTTAGEPADSPETRGALDYIINQGFPDFNELMRRYRGTPGGCGQWGESEEGRGGGEEVAPKRVDDYLGYSGGEFRIVPPGSPGTSGSALGPQIAPAASTCGPIDVNGDGVINIIDLVTVARKFGNYSAGLAEDVNSDGRINIIDLVTVARRFGERCQSTTGAYAPGENRVVFVPVPITKQSRNTGFASVLKSVFWVIGND